MRKTVFFICIILIVIMSGFFFSCSSKNKKILENLERTEGNLSDISSKRIAELKKGIDDYQKEVERTVKAASEIGIYYRLLGQEYMSLKMYSLALSSFKEAIYYYPENEVIFYYAGVCASRIAKSEMDLARKANLFKEAASYYKRAIKLNGGYTDALYALAVLDVFELNHPFDAIPLLEKVLLRNSKNTDALFLLARANVMIGKVNRAVEIYNEVIKISKDEEARNKARINRDTLLNGSPNG